MKKPIEAFDFKQLKEKMSDIKEDAEEKLKQSAATASEKASQSLRQGAELAEVAAAKIKQNAELVGEAAENAQIAYKNWRYRPIFPDGLVRNDNAWLPEMINIKKRDDRTAVEGFSEVIGFDENCSEKPIISILEYYAEEMDLEFFPTLTEDVYYVDPFDKHRYIQLDQYFNTLEQERIEELVAVAQDLGAKYIEISYVKEEGKNSKRSQEGNINGRGKRKSVEGSGQFSRDVNQNEMSKLSVKKSMNLPGMEPKKPTLRHFKTDIEINSIIDRRLHKENAIKGDYRCELSFNTSSGIKASNATSVESALKKVGIKITGKMRIVDEVMKEDSQKLVVYLKFPE